MKAKPIRNEADHIAALNEIARLWDAPDDTPDADMREVLVILVADYENRHYPVAKVAPHEILAHAIADDGRTQAELAQLLGSRSYASEVLAMKRGLTVEAIAKISKAWNIPVELLVDFAVEVKRSGKGKMQLRKSGSKKAA